MQIDETTAYSAFGSDVFTDAEMERRLPTEMYRALHRTMEEGTELTFEVAGAVATAPATSNVSSVPSSIVRCSARYISVGKRRSISASVNTSEPNALYAVVSSICMGSSICSSAPDRPLCSWPGAKLPAMRRLPRGALLAPDRVFPMVPHPPHNCNASGEIC